MKKSGQTADFSDCLKEYLTAWDSYRARGVSQQLDLTDKENRFDHDWKRTHYFSVGQDALEVMVKALIGRSRPMPKRILDFPSGSGRVTRHMQAFFDKSEITASDLYEPHLSFCEETFGVNSFLSREDLQTLNAPEKYDLIFCGSLLTHLPAQKFLDVIDFVRRSLAESGLAIFTLQGRYSDHAQRNVFKYLSDTLYEVAREDVEKSGFGYVDYGHPLKSVFNKQENYGIALVRGSWVSRQLEPFTDIRLVSYIERGWDSHQDVCIIQKTDIFAK